MMSENLAAPLSSSFHSCDKICSREICQRSIDADGMAERSSVIGIGWLL
jgi:hypothetical protein